MNQLRLADGTRLAWRLDGPSDAPVAVLLDGISCDGYAWPYLRPWLAERFQVLHVHWRGHGLSGVPRDPRAVTVPWLARDLDEVMQTLGLGPALFIGHSMGVQVTLEMAMRYPARVRAGVLLCGAAGRLLDAFQDTDLGIRVLPYIHALFERFRDHVAAAFRAFVPTELSWVVARYTELNREMVRREDFMPYLQHFAQMPPLLFTRMLRDAAERTSEAFLGRLDMPMLVVAGDRDGFTPSRLSLALAEALPDAEHQLLVGGSHTAPIEFPERIEAWISDFVSRRGLDGPAGEPASDAPPSLATIWRQAATERAAYSSS